MTKSPIKYRLEHTKRYDTNNNKGFEKHHFQRHLRQPCFLPLSRAFVLADPSCHPPQSPPTSSIASLTDIGLLERLPLADCYLRSFVCTRGVAANNTANGPHLLLCDGSAEVRRLIWRFRSALTGTIYKLIIAKMSQVVKKPPVSVSLVLPAVWVRSCRMQRPIWMLILVEPWIFCMDATYECKVVGGDWAESLSDTCFSRHHLTVSPFAGGWAPRLSGTIAAAGMKSALTKCTHWWMDKGGNWMREWMWLGLGNLTPTNTMKDREELPTRPFWQGKSHSNFRTAKRALLDSLHACECPSGCLVWVCGLVRKKWGKKMDQ